MTSVHRTQLILVFVCLILACCISGCTDRSVPASPGNVTALPPSAQSPGLPETAGYSESGSSGPVPPNSWIYQAPAGTTNAALLSGAKALMKGVYTYSPGSPDYLPGSYTGEKTSQTSYVVHSANSTMVVWAPVGTSQVIWQSEPGTSPRGWSGIVVAAGPVNTGNNPQVLNVKTDCSGFVTSLFANANTITETKFPNWSRGTMIPEAGCIDPQGSCTMPNPLNYYQLFVSGQNGWFRSVSLADLQPGDIISWANTNPNDKSASGHIMLVAAVSNGTDNTKSRQVVVIDETGPDAHSSDTRTSGAGIGMGYARLAVSPSGNLQFYWNLTTPYPQIGPVALGRAR